MNAARRLVSLALMSLCALGAMLALGTASGWATETHAYLSQFSEVPAVGPHGEAIPLPGPFSLGGTNALTVDSGEVYFAEGALGGQPSRLDTFDAATNAFTAQFPPPPPAAELELLDQGVAVGHSGGEAEVYVGADELVEGAPRGVVAVFDASGALRTVWTGTNASGSKEPFACFECIGPGDVAVDGSGLGWAAGDVYVADPIHDVVDVLAPETGGGEEAVAQLLGRSASEPFARPVAVAVTEAGEVLVADQREGDTTEIDIFKPGALAGQYEFIGTLTPPSGVSIGRVTALAANDGAGGIYVVADAVEAQSTTRRVFEFGAAGEFEGFISPASLPGGSFGAGLEHPEDAVPSGVAADPVSHRVYVSTTTSNGERPDPVFVFGPAAVLPDVATAAASSVQPTSATLNGTVNLAKAGPAACRFDWGTTPAFGQVAPCTRTVEAEGQVPVSVDLTALQPDTTYHYRLEATNENGTNEGEAIQNVQFKTPGPGLRAAWASEASSTAVTLGATIDPDGAPTSYYFQYGRSSEYEAEAPLAPGTQIGSGTEAVTVAQHVQGLSADTVYHYRVVAISELEVKPGVLGLVAFPGPDHEITTQGAGTELVLPDGRAWELVSSREKRGGLINGPSNVPLTQASAAGGAIMYAASAPPEGAVKGYDSGAPIYSVRGQGGWLTQNVALPHARATGLTSNRYSLFAEDLSLGLIIPFEFEGRETLLSGEASPPATESTPFLRHNFTCQSEPASCFEPLLTEAPGFSDVPPSTSDFGEHAKIAGATPSLARVVLTEPETGLYEWSAGASPAQALRPVSVLPAGEGGKLVAGSLDLLESSRHAVSEDGSRIAWTAAGGAGGLYLRDTAAGEGETVRLDAIQGGTGAGEMHPRFQVASGDGSTVTFTDQQHLTADAGGTNSLYVCTVAEVAGKLTCDLRDLTPGKAEVDGEVLGASADGSYLYFVATGALSSEEDNRHEKPVPGSPNLYMLHRASGEWEEPRLIAVLSTDDRPDWQAEGPTRASASGRYLTFMSDRPLTGYDNRDASSGAPDEEVFLYDAATGRLVCASCNPTGARPEGVEYGAKVTIGVNRLTQEPDWPSSSWVAAQTPMWVASGAHQPRFLSDEGRLFFDSSDALVPQDINHDQDVYEYEPAGLGNCATASVTFAGASGGCVGLITSGAASGESAFVDASENGEDVFFLAEKLVREDSDTALDIYDAHECTSHTPCVSSPAPSPACTTADACRAAPLPEPAIFEAPASATFSGAGNVTPSTGSPALRPKRLTRAQKLAAALRGCRAKKRRRRKTCERHARKRYAARAPRKVNAKKKGKR